MDKSLKLSRGARLSFIVPIFITVLLVAKFGVSVPLGDQYEMIPLFQERSISGSLISMLFEHHNEHRIAVPRTVQFVLGKATSWNIGYELGLNILVAIAGLIGLVKLVGKKARSPLFVAFFSALYFSPIQEENWLWGWQLEWFITSAAFVWMVYFLQQKGKKHGHFVALVLALVASFSTLIGVLCLLVGTGYVVLRVRRRRTVLLWLLALVMVLISYAAGFSTPNSSADYPKSLVRTIVYVPAYLGSVMSPQGYPALFIGMIGILVAVAIVWRQKRFGVGHSFMTLSLMSAAVTSLGRSHLGHANALSSRYTTIGLLFWAGLLLVLINEKRPVVRNVSLVLLAFLLVLSYSSGIRRMSERFRKHNQIYQCTRAEVPEEDCIKLVYPVDEVLARERLNWLKTNNYGGY